MTTGNDPNPGAAAGTTTTPGGPGGSDGGGSETPTGTIALAEHERIVAEERKRRAGQESTHKREMTRLKQQMDTLASELRTLRSTGAATAVKTVDVESFRRRLASPDLKVQQAAVIDGLEAMAEWTDTLAKERAQKAEYDRLTQDIQQALDEVMEDGIPREAIDTTSVPSVLRSAERWKEGEELRQLQSKVSKLEKELEDRGVDPVTQQRARDGATRTPGASGGEVPEPPTAIEEQIREIDRRIARIQQGRRGPQAMADLLGLQNQRRELVARR